MATTVSGLPHEPLEIMGDLDAVVAAAGELLAGSLGYEQAPRGCVSALALEGDPSQIWSIDNVHLGYLTRSEGRTLRATGRRDSRVRSVAAPRPARPG
jgi:hypothetical protein